ncbi:hypothetical protein V6N13_089141 [Hibiscus sabdariffa]
MVDMGSASASGRIQGLTAMEDGDALEEHKYFQDVTLFWLVISPPTCNISEISTVHITVSLWSAFLDGNVAELMLAQEDPADSFAIKA